MASPKSVIVVGAGIAGLACAYRLRQKGCDVTLLESGDTPGGVIGCSQREGFLFESGPQSFQLTPAISALVQELGLESELQTANPKAPRYVLKRGRLEKIPMSPPALLASQFLSVGSRWKIASEPFRRSKPPHQEESVAAFVRRKFGHEILEYLVSPFVSGVYAGDPEQLSLKAAFPSLDEWEREYGSVIRGAKRLRSAREGEPGKSGTSGPSLCSFAGGVATLPLAMGKSLGERLQIHTEARSITLSGGAYHVQTIRGDAAAIRTASAVVIAAPAYVAGEILSGVLPPLSKTLSAIPYAPVAVASAGYHRQQIGHSLDGFGFLVPRAEKVRTLGTIFNSSLFAGRAPEGSVNLTSFIGGATDLDAMKFADSEISRIAHDDNTQILKISGEPIVTHVTKWHRGLPQYNLGHLHIVETIRTLLREARGLFLTGNYLEGPALGKCVENGFATADSAEAYLNRA
jgi:oxygen-dependent protoporphyrinogen oxidase